MALVKSSLWEAFAAHDGHARFGIGLSWDPKITAEVNRMQTTPVLRARMFTRCWAGGGLGVPTQWLLRRADDASRVHSGQRIDHPDLTASFTAVVVHCREGGDVAQVTSLLSAV